MPDPIKVTFIGTGGVSSFGTRMLPSIAVRMRNELIILDAGEGCQYTLFRKKFHPVKSKLYILLSHVHTDHVNGLPGILHTLTLAKKRDIVHIIGPYGTKEFVRNILDAFIINPLPFILDIRETSCTTKLCKVISTGLFDIIAYKTEHDIDSLGYILLEKKRALLDVTKINALGIPPKLRKRILMGDIIELPNGKKIHPNEVTYNLRQRKIVYTGDTKPIKDLDILKAMEYTDLLIHEATFIKRFHKELALERFHSTVEDAIETGLRVKARRLALFHISPRYKEIQLITNVVNETLLNLGIPRKIDVLIPNDGETITL